MHTFTILQRDQNVDVLQATLNSKLKGNIQNITTLRERGRKRGKEEGSEKIEVEGGRGWENGSGR